MHKTVPYLLLALSVFFLSSCEEPGTTSDPTSAPKSTAQKQAPAKWDSLLETHTTGRIAKESSIRIRFKQPVVDPNRVGKSAGGLLSLKPSIKGKAVFETTTEIIFVPEEAFKSGQKYTVTLQPNSLEGLSAFDSPYQFDVNVIPLEYALELGALVVDPDNSAMMIQTGQLMLSDLADSDQVSKVLTASLQDQALAINWQADASGKQYHFTIPDIKRDTFATDLKLQWDGSPINVDTKGSQEVTIPALNEFKVVDIRRITPKKDKSYIQISLSDSRDQSQNLKGLIRLSKIPDSEDPSPKPVPLKLTTEGNIIKVFAKDGMTGKFNVAVESGLQSANGTTLGKAVNKTVELDTLKPGVRFAGKGHILPENDVLEIPFEAANVNAVQVSAFLVQPENIKQFFQINRLSEDDEMGRVGRYLWSKKIALNPANPAQWNRYSFDASELLRSHPGGLFRLELNIDRRFSTYPCPADTPAPMPTIRQPENNEDINLTEKSGWDGIEDYADNDDYYDWNWEDRNKPCKDAYFKYDDNPVEDRRNFIASNIGLLAKKDGHGNMLIVATDLRTSKPLAHVDLEIRNFQYDVLATAKTDKEGLAKVKLGKTPFLLIAKHGKEKGYLKLNAATALSVSHFDVGGDRVKKGLKGFIYGERGVWRPGDDIYLTFVLEDKENTIPENHPVSMQLINPKGRIVQTLTNAAPTGDFYTFNFKTAEEDETGKWLVKAKLGGNTFSRTITVETVRPNRLKIDLDFGTESLFGYEPLPEGKLFSQWLHGASAGGLKADVSVRFREKKTKFDRYDNYIFDDPARRLDSQDQKILEGRLDDTGTLIFNKQFKPKSNPPGMLSAWFTSRVFESGGAFSTSKQFMDYHPYKNYVGIRLPKGDQTRNMLLTDQQHTVEIASLNAKGELTDLNRVQVTLYKIDWKWWWDKSPESLAQFSNANHSRKLQQGIVQTTNGRGNWNFEIKYPDWGRYLVRACDLDGKHCTGETVYIDWPGWAGRAQEQESSAASTLNLFSDKKAYTVGDTAIVQLPEASQGRALVTVENGSDILSQQWVEFGENRQQVEIPVKSEMAPNVYVNVNLLQPHQNKANDRPIRLIGIIPLMVSDPETHLKPVLTADDEWKPLSTQTVEIGEANGQTMDYTLAMVDEGLLGLTRFKTPDLHKHFYRKEALGIKSWDLFDDVVGAYGGNIERLLALGGGDDVQIDDAANKPKRFPPVVQFLGPFHLDKGETGKHELKLPAYIGAVRIMAVAGHQGAYGNADKSIFVRQPLMMLPSLPRVLSVNEEAIIPVTLFSTKDDIKDVELRVAVDNLVSVVGDQKTTVHFEKTGDKLGFLRIKAGNKTGQTHIRFTAVSGEYKSESEVYLDIRRPNTETSRWASHTIEPGQRGRFSIKPHGIVGTNSATLELSTAPPLGLEKHLNYLVQYPHGCLEQTTSAAFPQLYLNRLLDTGEEKQKKIEHHISRAIDKIRSFQNSDGDFSYWPGGNERNKWSSLYAGHFLIEAEKQGYTVPPSLISDWLRYQSGVAQRWLAGSDDYAYVQAYRLYVLALAGKPELGAMNRFKENKAQGRKAKWLLAAAYQLAGQSDAANSIIQGLVADPAAKTEKHTDTFSTHLSDLGLQLNALTTLGKQQDAERFVEAIATELGKSTHNTHGLAWSLMAVSRYIGSKDGEGLSAQYALGNNEFSSIKSKKAYHSVALGDLSTDEISLQIKNDSATLLYASIISKGIPSAGEEVDVSSGLEITREFAKADGSEKLDMSTPIVQGQDIQIITTIRNTTEQDLENIALTQLMPSGWEIHNPLFGLNSKYDFQDVRDDRIYTYFSIKTNEVKTFTSLVNASYKGRFYLPSVHAEAMYEAKTQGRVKGRWISIEEGNEESGIKAQKAQNPGLPAQATIKADKSWLYDQADEKSKTTMYLVAGDNVSLLKYLQDKEQGEWYFVRFEGKSFVEKWIRKKDLTFPSPAPD